MFSEKKSVWKPNKEMKNFTKLIMHTLNIRKYWFVELFTNLTTSLSSKFQDFGIWWKLQLKTKYFN